MQIFLNGREVIFTRENEQFLSDILFKLKNWMEKNGFIIENAIVDGKKYDFSSFKELCNIKIDDVEKICIEAFSRLEVEYIQYSVIRNYFDALTKAIDDKNIQELKNLSDEYDEIQETLALKIKFVQDNDKHLENLLKNPTDENNIDEIKKIASSIVKLCQEGLDELQKYTDGNKQNS